MEWVLKLVKLFFSSQNALPANTNSCNVFVAFPPRKVQKTRFQKETPSSQTRKIFQNGMDAEKLVKLFSTEGMRFPANTKLCNLFGTFPPRKVQKTDSRQKRPPSPPMHSLETMLFGEMEQTPGEGATEEEEEEKGKLWLLHLQVMFLQFSYRFVRIVL